VHVYLATERMILRRFMPADVDLVTALDADPADQRRRLSRFSGLTGSFAIDPKTPQLTTRCADRG
jgi:hypothetical protein